MSPPTSSSLLEGSRALKRRASDTEFDLRNGSNDAMIGSSPDEGLSDADSTHWASICSRLVFLRDYLLAPITRAFRNLVSTRRNDGIETTALIPGVDHVSVKRAKTEHTSTASSYHWALNPTDHIGRDEIEAFHDDLVTVLDHHGIKQDFLKDVVEVSHIFDPDLRTKLQATACAVKVIETMYMSDNFVQIYHGDSLEIRPNLVIGSNKQAQETLSTASNLICRILDEEEPKVHAAKTTTLKILEDVRALRDGRIPPSLTVPCYGALDQEESLEGGENSFEPRDMVKTNDHRLLHPHIVGILKRGHACRTQTKRLSRARAMKMVTFRSPLIQPSPGLISRQPRTRYSRQRSSLIRPVPLLPGEGILSISGDVSLAWDKIQEQRERRDREEQEAARVQEEQRKKERLLRTGGLQVCQRTVLADPTPAMVVKGKHAAANPGAPVVVTVGGTQLHGQDFWRLVGETSWLNDEAVNGLLEALVNDINKKAGCDTKKNPKVTFVSSLSYDFMRNKPAARIQRALNRTGITEKAMENNLETILVPRCQQSHWTLGVIRPKDRLIFHLDSMGPGNSADMIWFLRHILEAALKTKYKKGEWEIATITSEQQSNGYDCGMFAIINSICVAVGVQPRFDGFRVPNLRYTISQVLMNGTFDGVSSLELAPDH